MSYKLDLFPPPQDATNIDQFQGFQLGILREFPTFQCHPRWGVTSPSIRTPKVPATKPRCIRRLGSDGVWVCLYGVSPPTTKWRWKLMGMALGFAMGQKMLNMGLGWGVCLIGIPSLFVSMIWGLQKELVGMMGAKTTLGQWFDTYCNTRLRSLKDARLRSIRHERNVPLNRTHLALQW